MDTGYLHFIYERDCENGIGNVRTILLRLVFVCALAIAASAVLKFYANHGKLNQSH